MKNHVGIIFFLGALASALLVGACGADDDCDALCTKTLQCNPEASRQECMKTCESMDFPPAFIECMTSLSCKHSETQANNCLRKIEPSRDCRTYCAKSCIEYDDLCGVECTLHYPSEVQKCLAEINGDTCEGADACLFGMPLPEVD